MLDIVIVNYNSTNYILRCLQSIYSELDEFSAQIWVEDNASSDGVHRITEHFPEVNLSCHKRNLGFAAAVNHALKKGIAPYVVLLNPDSWVMTGFFSRMIAFMELNPRIAIAGPRILDEDGSVQGSARAFPTPLTALFGRSSLFSRIFPNNPITSSNILTNRSDGIHPLDVDWVSGACMVVRRQAVHEVGCFDERFFMYWEDADWCKRMWDGGWKVVYYPQASIVHHVGVSSSQLMVKSRFEFHKSVYLLFEKYNPDIPWIIKIMVLGILLVRFGAFLASEKICFAFCALTSRQRSDPSLSTLSRKIRVMRLIARLNVGGPSIHVYLLSTGLDPNHFETLLVTGIISHQEGDMEYLFWNSPLKPHHLSEMQRDIRILMDIRVIYRIFLLIRKFRPDIVHTHTAKAGFTARIPVLVYNLLMGKNVKIVHSFHGHVFEGYFSRIKSRLFVYIERILAWFTNVIIAISESQRKDLVEKYHIASSIKVRTIELGFDLSPFLFCSRFKGSLRKMLGLADETILVGIIGRLVPIKNHELFFEAAQRILSENPTRSIKFVIVGDGECRSGLEEYCKRHQLTEHVFFLGWVQNVSAVYADLDILALTSLNEGTPVSIIEAMASSVPVIATRVGGIQDLLGKPTGALPEKGDFAICERGIVCPNGDSIGFSRGLNYLFSENNEVRQIRIQHAMDYVMKRYDKERLLKDISMLYNQLLNDKVRM